MTQTKLSSIPMNSGEILRCAMELHKAYCKDCDKTVTEWGEPEDILSQFIDHRKKVHHSETTYS